MDSIRINEHGQILLPLEVSQILNLQNNDSLKVKIESDRVLLIPQTDGLNDNLEEILDQIIHEGILIDVK
ncbi:hypothetical protein JCM14036_31240 [Desulfotomaculum defluvii]